MFTALLIFQVVLGLSIIALVLLQQGKGADMGAAFGAGASGTVFGARGGGSFFTRATAVLAALFFINSVLLSSPLVLGERHPNASVTDSVVTMPLPGTSADSTDKPPETIDLPPADLPELDRGQNAVDTPPAETSAPSTPAAALPGGADKKPE